MIEGLWIVKFLTPNDPQYDLSGGAVVIETGRVLGGDSGYFYVGELDPGEKGRWDIALQVTRHDPTIVSAFGDVDTINLAGFLLEDGVDSFGRSLLLANLRDAVSGMAMTAQLTKVTELP